MKDTSFKVVPSRTDTVRNSSNITSYLLAEIIMQESVVLGGTARGLQFRFFYSRWWALYTWLLLTIDIRSPGQLAAKLKLNAPYAHTWLEIVGVRWGKTAHLIFMFFGWVPTSGSEELTSAEIVSRLATNIIVSSMLILGGSATVTDLTGMSTLAVSAQTNDDQGRLTHSNRHVSLYLWVWWSTWLSVACVRRCCVTSECYLWPFNQWVVPDFCSKVPIQQCYSPSFWFLISPFSKRWLLIFWQ